MTKLIICGVKGRMGRTLVACAQGDAELQLVGDIDIGDDLSKIIYNCDVVVDFTLRDATLNIAKVAAAHNKALVIGTTGHSEAERKVVTDAVSGIPVVWTSNFSTGVNALFWATAKVAEVLGKGFDAEIVETHHNTKKDAPSGTAKRLQEILKQARGQDALAHSLRVGDVVGEHTVVFAAAGERLELTHRATSRETFARGALRAAKWVVHQRPGLYDMQDVLGLR